MIEIADLVARRSCTMGGDVSIEKTITDERGK